VPILAGAHVVAAPLLGTFYPRPKPGEPPFVQVGDRVEADTVLCIVEGMTLMNSVHAGRAGTIAAVHAQEGALVEFGQPLFSIVDAA
jgi:acetyl-CoA carboxylase biotin carboxyl carrier protein